MSLETCKLEVLDRAFPELKEQDISVAYKDLDEGYFQLDSPSPNKYEINVDPSFRNAPRGAVLGGIAHEMSHLVRIQSQKPYMQLLAPILLAISERYHQKDELETDLLVTERGLGAELYALHTHRHFLNTGEFPEPCRSL